MAPVGAVVVAVPAGLVVGRRLVALAGLPPVAVSASTSWSRRDPLGAASPE